MGEQSWTVTAGNIFGWQVILEVTPTRLENLTNQHYTRPNFTRPAIHAQKFLIIAQFLNTKTCESGYKKYDEIPYAGNIQVLSIHLKTCSETNSFQ